MYTPVLQQPEQYKGQNLGPWTDDPTALARVFLPAWQVLRRRLPIRAWKMIAWFQRKNS